MNTKIIAGIGAVAVAAGIYFTTQSSAPTTAPLQNVELEYVPADTALFFGSLVPFDYEKYLSLMPAELRSVQQQEVFEQLSQGENHVALRFFAELMNRYSLALASEQQMKQQLGIDGPIRSLIYTVGLIPTIRVELAEPATLEKTVMQSADKTGIVYKTETLQGQSITRYDLQLEGESPVELITSTKGKWFTLTVNTTFNNESDLAVALGLEKPQSSLANSQKLERYISDFNFDGNMISYLDHQAVVNGLTAQKPSRLSRMIDSLLSASGEQDALATIRSKECQTDYAAIAAKWPATVSGTTSQELTSSYYKSVVDTTIVINDDSLNNILMGLRGFIPAYLAKQEDSLFGFGVGVDVAQLAPTVSAVWNQITTAEVSCPELVQLQAQIKQNNPMAIAMATGMAGSVKGISASFSAFDLEFPNGQQTPPEVKALDGLVVLSADQPQTLIDTAKSLDPAFAQLEIPADGSPVVLNDLFPLPPQIKQQVLLAIKGQHLVLSVGEKSAKLADTLSGEVIKSNGLIRTNFDLQSFFTMMADMMESSGETLPPEFAELQKQNMSFGFELDLTEKGILLRAEGVINKD
ncbi:hypothetical protein ACSLBF_12495 [Pseudoalteromonas sp. T1lg65]|uniref:hypothetical protein n=1 Tax=Pseudoalteromonas sp. T1lg65 TaxID=2077101 RepID=UPI003F7A00D6